MKFPARRYICLCVQTYDCEHMHTFVCVCVYMCVWGVYRAGCVYEHVHVCIRVFVHVCVYMCVYVCVYVCVCTCVCMYVCECSCRN